MFLQYSRIRWEMLQNLSWGFFLARKKCSGSSGMILGQPPGSPTGALPPLLTKVETKPLHILYFHIFYIFYFVHTVHSPSTLQKCDSGAG